MNNRPDAWVGKKIMEVMPQVGAGIIGYGFLFASILSIVGNRFHFIENPGYPLLYGINAVVDTCITRALIGLLPV